MTNAYTPPSVRFLDSLLAFRTFVGRSGQRLQGFLRKLGIQRSYIMVNTFLFGVLGQFDNTLRLVSTEPPILQYRNMLLDRIAKESPIVAVVTIGAGARHAAEQWSGAAAYPVFELVHPAAPQGLVLPNWNQHLSLLHDAIPPDEGAPVDLSPYGGEFAAADEAPIPRFDLPFGVPAWHGTGGGRSRREGPNTILWAAP
ncbi:MAG: uracil-DNA glycosylase [Gemmatimonadetes bacterium]|nr:uracil-DNA glycosylase [Gemmatimonadota bacterium]